jgi:ureidoglycolate dehydrogenase (NAD+)
MAARDRGEPVPVGWGLDAQGHDTTDPKKIATLTPLGGPKGSGLSLMIECLASLTVGSPLISLALAGGLAEDPFLNGVAIAVDLAAIGDLDRFTTEVDRLGDAITGLPRAAGVDHILLPGERGDAILAEREANGIPVAEGTWKRLVAAAHGLGVKTPA